MGLNVLCSWNRINLVHHGVVRTSSRTVRQRVSLPPNIASPILTGASAAAPIANIYTVDPHQQTAYTMNFSTSIQRQLPMGVFAEVAYVGNLRRHRLGINTPGFAHSQIVASYPSATRPSVNAYRPYLGFSSIYMRLGDSNSNYNALQA